MSRFNETPVRLSGWGRHATAVSRRIHVAASDVPAALEGIHRTPADAGQLMVDGTRGVIARGAGRSYADASLNHQGHVLTIAGVGMRWHDRANGLLHVDAGATLEAIDEFARGALLMLPVVPGSMLITVGGAIAADVHGKNHTNAGSFASYVHQIDLIDGTGQPHTLTPHGNGNLDAFWATTGGMGLTGVITGAVIALHPRRDLALVMTERSGDLPALFSLMTARRDEFEHTVAWVDPRTQRSVLSSARLVTGLMPHRDRSRTLPDYAPKLATHRHLITVGSHLRWVNAGLRSGITTMPTGEYLHPLDRIKNWNEVCGAHGFTQYQCTVEDPALVVALLDRLDRQGVSPFLITIKAFGAANLGMLSFPRPGWTLAVDIALDGNTTHYIQLLSVLSDLDELVATNGGSVYLAKNAVLQPDLLERMYPRLSEFQAVRRRLDPHGIFQSDLSRRCGLSGSV